MATLLLPNDFMHYGVTTAAGFHDTCPLSYTIHLVVAPTSPPTVARQHSPSWTFRGCCRSPVLCSTETLQLTREPFLARTRAYLQAVFFLFSLIACLAKNKPTEGVLAQFMNHEPCLPIRRRNLPEWFSFCARFLGRFTCSGSVKQLVCRI